MPKHHTQRNGDSNQNGRRSPADTWLANITFKQAREEFVKLLKRLSPLGDENPLIPVFRPRNGPIKEMREANDFFKACEDEKAQSHGANALGWLWKSAASFTKSSYHGDLQPELDKMERKGLKDKHLNLHERVIKVFAALRDQQGRGVGKFTLNTLIPLAEAYVEARETVLEVRDKFEELEKERQREQQRRAEEKRRQRLQEERSQEVEGFDNLLQEYMEETA